MERYENSLWNLKPPKSPDPEAEECGLGRQISQMFPQPWSTDKPTTNNSSNHSKQHHCHLILVQTEGLESPFQTIVAPHSLVPGIPGATGHTFLSLDVSLFTTCSKKMCLNEWYWPITLVFTPGLTADFLLQLQDSKLTIHIWGPHPGLCSAKKSTCPRWRSWDQGSHGAGVTLLLLVVVVDMLLTRRPHSSVLDTGYSRY